MIRHIVAIDSKRGFAKDGVTPWELPTDKLHYRMEIQKHRGVLLMGRKTLERVGTWAADYQCYVLTHNEYYRNNKAIVIHDATELLAVQEDIWVIGGSAIYDLTLPLADELHITQINADFNCDRFYPEFEETFKRSTRGEDITEGGVTFHFDIYRPRTT